MKYGQMPQDIDFCMILVVEGYIQLHLQNSQYHDYHLIAHYILHDIYEYNEHNYVSQIELEAEHHLINSDIDILSILIAHILQLMYEVEMHDIYGCLITLVMTTYTMLMLTDIREEQKRAKLGGMKTMLMQVVIRNDICGCLMVMYHTVMGIYAMLIMLDIREEYVTDEYNLYLNQLKWETTVIKEGQKLLQKKQQKIFNS